MSDALGKELRGDAIIVGWDPGPQERKPAEPPWSPKESLDELELLCEALSITVKDKVLQQWRPDRGRLPLGRGRLEQLNKQVEADPDVGIVIFDKDLSMKELLTLKGRIAPTDDCVIIDRTSLILRIFAQRARTKEAKLQVTLASQQYMMPRLRYYLTEGGGLEAKGGSGGGGGAGGGQGGALKGSGETQYANDKSRLTEQMSKVRKKLKQVQLNRQETRKRTKAVGLPIIALVGYTNAGKSTLLNRMCDSNEVEAKDQLFQTLDPTRRRVSLETGREAFVIDTVGFIQRLPEQLVAGFKATLEELSEADVVLHVIDISCETMYQQVGTVEKTLRTLKSYDVQTPQLLVFNKIDKLGEDGVPEQLKQSLEFPWKGVKGHVQISARNNIGIDTLAEAIEQVLQDYTGFGAERMQILIPYTESGQYSKLRGPTPLAKIESEEHTADGYLVDVVASTDAARQLSKWEVPESAQARAEKKAVKEAEEAEEEMEGDEDDELEDGWDDEDIEDELEEGWEDEDLSGPDEEDDEDWELEKEPDAGARPILGMG